MAKRKNPSGGALRIEFIRDGIGWTNLRPYPVLSGSATAADSCLVSLSKSKAGSGMVFRAMLTNKGSRPMRLRAIRWVSDLSTTYPPPAIRFPKNLEPFYFATENFRGDYFGTTTTRGEHYFRPLPQETVTIGFTEDAYFPGVFIGSGTAPLGMVCAAASRDIFETKFQLFGGDGVATWNFEIEHVPQGLEWIEIPAGASVASEGVFFDIVQSSDPQQSLDNYYRLLKRAGFFDRRKTNPLPRQRIWGSWNFGPQANVTEDYVLRQLPVIGDRFPLVKFVQIDHGYERVYPSGQRAQIDLCYGGGDAYDMAKFPSGPRELVRQIRSAGLRPATWLGLWAAGTSPMIKEHPEWVLRDDMGRPLAHISTLSAVTGGPFPHAILDLSVPAVRKYIEHVCKTVFSDWGFEGIKLDFFSFMFQVRRARFRNGGRTAAQYLAWLADTFRKYLPTDGFLGWCSAVGTGTPFARQADYFRCSEDIGDGNWELAKRIALWTLNTNMLLREHPTIPNIDSIGWAKDFTPDQWLSFLSLCAVSGGTMEISGDLTQLDDEKIQRMNQCLELCELWGTVRCLDVPTGKVGLPPSLWVSQTSRGIRLAAIINWAGEPRTIDSTPLDELNPSWRRSMRPAWPSRASVQSSSVKLPPYASMLVRAE